ncbi:MAG: hypothetical protein Q7S25_01155 [Candidatus Limnocylindria bacterium]|nr:hypothetical protein [Candidatus Limnocylindria bacterium]
MDDGAPRRDPEVARLLAVPDLAVNTERALTRVRARAARPSLRRVPVRWLQGLAATAAVVLVASTLTLSGFAESLLTIFEPQRFVAIPVSMNDLKIASDLERYGALTWGAQPKPTEVADASAARAAAGFAPLVPASPPSGLRAARWSVLLQTSATFTFSAASARDAATRAGRTPPPMPAGMDGSRLVFTAGTTIVQSYSSGTSSLGAQTLGGQALSGQMPAGMPAQIPALVVVQMRAPTVASDGVSLDDLRAYLLAQPGVSPQLAAQIKAISDPAHTLPVPVPAGQASTKNVKVRGTDGLFVGDSTGLGSGVVWRSGDFVFGVAGTLTESELLATANSLR